MNRVSSNIWPSCLFYNVKKNLFNLSAVRALLLYLLCFSCYIINLHKMKQLDFK